jgi:hypothetical protein
MLEFERLLAHEVLRTRQRGNARHLADGKGDRHALLVSRRFVKKQQTSWSPLGA